MTEPAQPKARPVLVVEAQTIGAIAVIRSLGRAGRDVHAVSPDQNALGLRSRFAARAVVSPRYASPAYLEWLADYLEQNDIGCIIPSESFLLRVRERFDDFAHLMPLSHDARTVYRGLAKFDVHRALASAGAPANAHLPPTEFWEDGEDLPVPEDLERLTPPLFVKVDGVHARRPQLPARVARAESAREAVARMDELRADYSRILVQGFVPGRGVGAFFLLWDGEVRAQFMHERLHEVPHTGGTSALRASCMHPAILEDALAKLRALEWKGVAMLEYRREDATGQFSFIELNGRFWGSLHLALYAGVDFPRLLVECFSGGCAGTPPTFRLGARARLTVPLEVQYVLSRMRDVRVPVGQRIRSVFEFFALSLDPSVRSDLLFPGDRRLFWIMLRDYVVRTLSARDRSPAG